MGPESNRIDGLVKRGRERFFFFLCTKRSCEHRGDGGHVQAWRRGLRMKPVLLVPWSWTLSLQSCEKDVSVVQSIQSVFFFVMAALAVLYWYQVVYIIYIIVLVDSCLSGVSLFLGPRFIHQNDWKALWTPIAGAHPKSFKSSRHELAWDVIFLTSSPRCQWCWCRTTQGEPVSE